MARKFYHRMIALAGATLLLLTCSLGMQQPTSQPIDLSEITVTDVDRHEIAPLNLAPDEKAVVFFFIGVDCPISNSYVPVMAEIFNRFHDKGIRFYSVYCDPSTTLPAMKQHHDDYKFPFPALLDEQQKLMEFVKAKVTPDVVVAGPDGVILYHGRIDDRYAAIGKPRYTPTKHELLDALIDIMEDKPIAVKTTEAIGCSIPVKTKK